MQPTTTLMSPSAAETVSSFEHAWEIYSFRPEEADSALEASEDAMRSSRGPAWTSQTSSVAAGDPLKSGASEHVGSRAAARSQAKEARDLEKKRIRAAMALRQAGADSAAGTGGNSAQWRPAVADANLDALDAILMPPSGGGAVATGTGAALSALAAGDMVHAPVLADSAISRLNRLKERLALGGDFSADLGMLPETQQPKPERDINPPADPRAPATASAACTATSSLGAAAVGAAALPPNWVQRRDNVTGRKFYANILTKETSWVDPRPETVPDLPSELGKVDWDMLPRGWERITNAAGEVYFADHHTKSTTWLSPRDAQHLDDVEAVEAWASTYHLRLKQLEGVTEALQQETGRRQSAVEALQARVDVVQNRIHAPRENEDPAQLRGQAIELESQLKAERAQLGGVGEAILSVLPGLGTCLKRVRATEQMIKELGKLKHGPGKAARALDVAQRQRDLSQKVRGPFRGRVFWCSRPAVRVVLATLTNFRFVSKTAADDRARQGCGCSRPVGR